MKKKLLSFIIMCVMAVSILFVGCTPKGLGDNPPTDANVTSNGGMTVVKGDYLYYVNGYVDESTLTKDDNKSGKVTHSAIYRTKLVDGEIQKDKEGFVTNTECVVSRVVGFGNGGFYIIDDYIYYGTPYMNLDRDGVLQSSRVEFHRININGTDDKTLYVTSKSEDELDWTLYKIDNTVYLATFCDSKIIIVNTGNPKDTKTIENVTSYAFLKEEDYKTGMAKNSELQNYIYYTRATTTKDNLTDYKGNVIAKVNIASGEVTEYLDDTKDYTYKVMEVTPNTIYYTKTNSRISGLELLHKKDLTKSWKNAEEVKLSNAVYTSYFVCPFGIDLIIANDSNGTYLLEANETKKISNSQRTILGMSGNYAYYLNSNALYKFDVRANVTENEIVIDVVGNTDKTHTITNSNYIDFDGQRVYVYCDYTSADGNTNTYLNYVDDKNTERFVGVFANGDTPEQPEQDEDYGKDPDVKYIPWID